MWLWLLVGCPWSYDPPDLAINEVMSANDTAFEDPAADECPEFDDWIELLNTSDAPVSTEGVLLVAGPDRMELPATLLDPGERVLVWADGQPEQGDWHAPFGISRQGERVELWTQDILLDGVDVPAMAGDESWARITDGAERFAATGNPTPGEPNGTVLPEHPCFEVENGAFDDHAYACIPDREGFFALASDRASTVRVVKFDIFAFGDPAERRIEFMDTRFYKLHDEYYIYTVLNGEPFQELPAYPPYPGEFSTWKELEDWARSQEDLEAHIDADQARFSGERLFSSYFYREINGPDRDLGVGTLVYYPPTDTRDELWGFELEAADAIDEASLAIYFETLQAHGPPEMSDVVWLVRSTVQEELALQLEAEGSPLAQRMVRYSELAVDGEIEVYNPGITAGRTFMVRAGEDGLEDSRDDYILVLDEIPDYLPPCRALITSVPQTPLSHVSLLARSRGIPNLYVAGITEDTAWDAWKRVRAHVAIEATEDDFRFVQIDADTTSQWVQLQETVPPQLQSVDASALPYAVDLATAPDMLELRSTFGGKSAGLRQIMATGGVDVPDTPMALSVRAYFEHMATLPDPSDGADPDWLAEMLSRSPFLGNNDRALRYAVLHGANAYAERYPSDADARRLASLIENRDGAPVAELARTYGLMGHIQAFPPAGEEAIRSALVGHFSTLPADQKLRFRSSSTVEDIEGFNGAGLYTSVSGSPDDPADALTAVWASYWGSEAFEERRRANVPHLQGGMGVLVHPRFDDDFERANAVITLTRDPSGDWEMLCNAQIGAISLANPPTTCPPVLPEQNRVTDAGIERLAASSETDGEVLSDAELLALYEDAIAVAEGWLEAENAPLAPTRRRSVVTLDLEARAMSAGWIGSAEDRLVVKQARTLDPSPALLPSDVRSLLAPEDLLGRAAGVRRMTCVSDALYFSATLLYTDPLQLPDMGFAEHPFVVEVDLWANDPIPELEWTLGQGGDWTHLEMEASYTGDLVIEHANGTVVVDGTSVDIVWDGLTATRDVACETDTLWASPDDFLREQLDGSDTM